MRNVNSIVLSGADTGSVNGNAIDANQLISGSFHAVFGDATAVGTVKIQASNDVAPIQYTGSNGVGPFTPSNWADIPSASASVTGGASVIISLAQMNYRWVRAVYTHTAGGSSTVIVNMNALSM